MFRIVWNLLNVYDKETKHETEFQTIQTISI